MKGLTTLERVLLRALILIAATALCLGIASGTATAQAIATADQRAQVSIFAGFSYVQPDYKNDFVDSTLVTHNLGMEFGGEYDLRPIYHLFSPGFELIVQHSSGVGNAGNEAETQFAGGPKLQFHLGRIQPYVGYLFGFGTVLYPYPVQRGQTIYSGENSFVMDAQVGADYQLTPRWGIRANLMAQRWARTPPETFNPWSASIGVKYRFFARRVR